MIDSKESLKHFVYCDEIARWGKKVSLLKKLKTGDLWGYMIILRKLEYSINCRRGLIKKISVFIYKLILKHYSVKTGWSIPPNVFGPGLLVVHRGTVVVNPKARIGENCRVHVCVNVGDWNNVSPIIGNDVYIGPGAKIFGGIEIADGIAIGANSVVNKSFLEKSVSIAGIPARVVSKKGNKYNKLGCYKNS